MDEPHALTVCCAAIRRTIFCHPVPPVSCCQRADCGNSFRRVAPRSGRTYVESQRLAQHCVDFASRRKPFVWVNDYWQAMAVVELCVRPTSSAGHCERAKTSRRTVGIRCRLDILCAIIIWLASASSTRPGKCDELRLVQFKSLILASGSKIYKTE